MGLSFCEVVQFGGGWGLEGYFVVKWDTRMLELVDSSIGSFFVSTIFRNLVDGVEWMFLRVYGPNVDSNRSLLWDELVGVRTLWDLSWYIGGDFNVTRFPSERLGGGEVGLAMEFSDFISKMGLLDIPLSGVPSCGPIIVIQS